MPCVTGTSEADHPLPDEAAEETVQSEDQIKERTERFLFGDPTGVKATGPSGAARRTTLGLVVTCLAVLKQLWPSRRPEIKALLADEQGWFDKEELLAHIINNALGRPLLPPGKPTRDVGTAANTANNALKKEKKDTAEAKSRTSNAGSAARAAARKDPALLPGVAAAEAARAAELAAVLAQEYGLNLPTFTVGAKRKALDLSDRCCGMRSRRIVRRSRSWHGRSTSSTRSGRSLPSTTQRISRTRLARQRRCVGGSASEIFATARRRRSSRLTRRAAVARRSCSPPGLPTMSRRRGRRRAGGGGRRWSDAFRVSRSHSRSSRSLSRFAARMLVACLSLRLSCRSRCAGFDRFGYQTPKICLGGLEE